MPRKSEKIKIAGTSYDRREKLSESERAEIRERYKNESLSTRKLAAEYGVSRRLITFILDPDKYNRAREQFKERRKDGRYKQSPEEWAATMREHRNYKNELFKKGLIKEEPENNE